MQIRSRMICLAAVSIFLAAVTAPRLLGEVLIRQNFEQAEVGKAPTGAHPGLGIWEADDAGPLGSITVATVDAPAGPTNAVQITNVAHKEGRAPGLNLRWDDPASGVLSVSYRFMTPIDGPFLSVHYFGGDWNTGAGIFIIENGSLLLQYGEKGARLTLGSYKPNEWHAVRFDFDVTAHKLDVFLDGQQRANDLPWQSGAEPVGKADLFADFRPIDHGGAPVLFIDDIAVESAPAPLAPATRPAAMKGAGRSFRYGVGAHLGRYKGESFEKLIEAIDRLGVDIVRTGIDWTGIEPEEGRWTFDRMDKIVNDLTAKGVEMETLLAFSTKWASTGPTNTKDWHDWNNRAPRLEPFKKYAATMVNRYKDRIHYWEIWNEPEIAFWLSPTDQYTELFNATSAVIAQADPTAKVMNGGFALNRRPPNMNFLTEFLAGADPTHWDIWAWHDYHTFPQFIARQKENAQYYNSKKLTIPNWVNEGGFHTLLKGGEPEQAITLAKKMAVAPALGASAYIWYDLIDDGNDPHDPEHHFGLLHSDFSPKPAFTAYQAVIRELSPLKFAKKLPNDDTLPGLWGLLYQSPNDQHDHVLVLWREGKGRQTPLWIGTAKGGSATAVFAMDGSPLPSPALEGGLLVTVSDAPVYVHLRGSLEPVVRPFVSLPDKLAVLPGHDSPLQIQITNPTSNEATFAVTLKADKPSIRFGSDRGETSTTLPGARLSSGASTTLATTARLVDPSAGATAGSITVSLRPSAGGPAVEAQLPYIIASAVPQLADARSKDIPAGEGLELKMLTADSIVNLFSAEPNAAMHWHGPDDLSATARLAYTADALYLHVIATDDTHAQPNHGAEIWRGDCMQLAIRTDDGRPEYFEAGLALGDDGKPQGWLFTLPANSLLAVGAIEKLITYDVRRDGKQTHYTARIPWKSLGSEGPPATGLRLNFIVNDDDGLGRKGWVQLSDGIGKDKDANLFMLFVCDTPSPAPTR